VFEDDLDGEEFMGCPVCLCEHDAEIHDATLNVHCWLRAQVTRWLPEDDIPLDDEPVEYLLIETSAA
jgi:hypothetical protein